jgi:hypothetical protein
VLAVNELIAAKWDGKRAVLTQREVVIAVLVKLPGVTREEIFDLRYLDFEDVYREAGWTVSYDKPDYTDVSEPTFTFTRGKSR